MVGKIASPRVFFPRTIADALELSGAENNAVFWAGGTTISRQQNGQGKIIKMPRVVISLSLVEEMARASRTENSLEVGAMMTLDRLADIGKKALPPGMPEVLSGIGTRPFRCRATIGGNIAATGRKGDLTPLLQMLDAKIEVRYLRERRGRRKPVPSIRKIPLIVLEEENGLRRGDLITRISIPTEQWNFAAYEKLPPASPDGAELIFQAVARIEKSTLVDWRMSFWDGQGPILKDRDIEAALAGSPLPVSRRSMELLDEAVIRATESWGERNIDRDSVKCLARLFMRRAGG